MASQPMTSPGSSRLLKKFRNDEDEWDVVAVESRFHLRVSHSPASRSPASRRRAIGPGCSCRRHQKLGEPDQIVSRERQREGGVHPVSASQLHLGQTGGTLDPAKYFFDAFAAALADAVADMTRGAIIDGCLAPLAGFAEVPVDRDMRRDRPTSQVVHKLRDVIGLVGAQGNTTVALSAILIDQLERLFPFGNTGRLADAAADRQAMTVLHQGMPHIAKLGRLSVTLPVELRFRIGRALVRFVGAFLLVKVTFRVATGSWAVVVATVRPAEALDRSPRLDQRTVHREVITRQQPLHLLLSQNRRQELRGNLSLQQPVAILGER